MPVGGYDPYPQMPAPRGRAELPGGAPGATAGAAPIGAGGIAPVDYWNHVTLTPAAFGLDGAQVDLGATVEKLEIGSDVGDVVYVAWNGPARPTPGTYKAKAPGGGILTIPVPGIRQLWLWVGTSGVPVANIEVYAYAGRYAAIALG